jgi:hypothetical protein
MHLPDAFNKPSQRTSNLVTTWPTAQFSQHSNKSSSCFFILSLLFSNYTRLVYYTRTRALPEQVPSLLLTLFYQTLPECLFSFAFEILRRAVKVREQEKR